MWILPTRGRPASLVRFIDAWNKTGATTPVMLRLDDDDVELPNYVAIELPKNFVRVIGPRIGLARSINQVFEIYPNEPWYGLLADDLLPQTPGWDKLLTDKASCWNISYPNDLGKLPDLPTHPCVGGDLIRAIGWFGFPPTKHYFVDTIWQYIGQHLDNIHRLDDVIVEHLHYSTGKSEMDQNYQESSEKWQHDKRAYKDWCNAHGKQLIEKLAEIYKQQ
jgi:hypothetical protein